MTNDELENLFTASMKRFDELKAKYRSGARMSRQDCLEMQKMNERLHLVGHELLLLVGDDGDPAYDCFRQPHVKQPLPASMRQRGIN